jgi:gliding motility-associated-like protein
VKKRIFYIYFLLAFSGLIPGLKAQSPNGIITPNINDTVCVGTSGFLTLSGFTPGTLTVQYWTVSTSGCNDINPTHLANTNLTNTFFMVPNDLYYYAVFSNGDTSACFHLVVDQPSDAGTVSGGGIFCGTAVGSFTSSGSNGTILGWYQQNGSNWNSLGNTTTTYNFTGASTTGNYAFMTYNGTCPPDTAFASISVDAISDAGMLSSPDTVCATSNSGLLNVSNVTGNVQGWNFANSASGPFNPLGTTASSYTYSGLVQNTWYYVIAKNGICPPDTSNTVQISVDQAPVAGSITGGGYFCGAFASGTLTLSGYSGTIVQWQSAPTSSGTWTTTSCSGPTCGYSNLSAPATFFQVEIDNGVCPSVFTAFDTVIYSAATVAGTLSTNMDTVCSGVESPTLTLSGYTANNFQWQLSVDGGANWVNIPAYTTAVAPLGPLNDTTWYRVIVKNNSCSSVTSNIVSILVHQSPFVSITTPDAGIMVGSSVVITANGTGTPVWSPAIDLSSTNTFTTTSTPSATITYTVNVDGGYGCTAMDSIKISVHPLEFTGFISNAITPNGDGINDAFYVENIEAFKSSEVVIFNEYGQEVYRAAPYHNDWKGTYNNARLPDGTYYYVLRFSDTNLTFKGSLTLISQK